MNKITSTAAALLLSLGLASAQSPTTTYPYLYPEFLDGTVVMDDGNNINEKLNIQIRKDRLHYLDDGIIKEAFLDGIVAVEIGKDVFIPVLGQMMKVATKDDKGCIAAQILGDFDEAIEAKGAYGSSSTTSATMKLSSVQTDNEVNKNHMNLLNEKDQGFDVKLVTKYYLVTPKIKCRATKKEIEAALPMDMEAGWKSFLKSRKIRWNEPVSLLEVVDYLNQ